MPATEYLKAACGLCAGHVEFPPDLAGQSIECPHCQQIITLPAISSQPVPQLSVPPPSLPPTSQQRNPTGRKVKKGEFIGVGAAVQAVGCLAFLLGLVLCTTVLGMLFGFVGIIVGLLLLIIGGRMAIKLICSNCGNKLSGKEVMMCPVCHCQFDR